MTAPAPEQPKKRPRERPEAAPEQLAVTLPVRDLKRALAIVGPAVSRRTKLPITSHVHIARLHAVLRFRSTDLDMAIEHDIALPGGKTWERVIPFALMRDLVRTLPDGDSITLQPEPGPAGKLRMLAPGGFSCRLAGMDQGDFPRSAPLDGKSVLMEPGVLGEAAARTVTAISPDDSRPVLTAVCIQRDEKGEARFAAADGFRLYVFAAGGPWLEREVNVPGRALGVAGKLFSGATAAVRVTVDAACTRVQFAADRTRLAVQLVQGSFPNYLALIPKDATTRVSVPAAGFQAAVRSVRRLAVESSGIVRLEASPGAWKVSAFAIEIGDVETRLMAVVEGDSDAKIAINASYLADILKAAGGEHLVLEMTTPSSPLAVRVAGDERWVGVVMPMFIQWGN